MLFTTLSMKLYYSYYNDLCNRLVHILAATPFTKRGRVLSHYTHTTLLMSLVVRQSGLVYKLQTPPQCTCIYIQWEKAWEISSHAVMSCNIRMQSHKGQYSIITVYIYLGLCMDQFRVYQSRCMTLPCKRLDFKQK